jgi:hypothetical protein
VVLVVAVLVFQPHLLAVQEPVGKVMPVEHPRQLPTVLAAVEADQVLLALLV